MKKILVIVSQGNLNHLLSNETLSAVMVLATFGHDVRVLLRESAFSLLYAHGQFDAQKHPFKLASNMVESFEFYDLFPILIEQQYQQHPLVEQCEYELDFVQLNAELLQQFDQVLTF